MATTDRRGVSVDATDSPIAGDPNPGLAVKAPCLVATTGNITLSGPQTVDGVAVGSNNERVLVWQQTDATTNGLYNATSSGAWTRAIDADGNDDLAAGLQLVITGGSTYAGTVFRLTSADPISLGTSALNFTVASVTATRKINTTAPLAGGGDFTADRTLSLTINGSLQVTGGALAVAQSTAAAHQWVTSFSAAGVPQTSQPAVGDISGGQALNGVNDTNVTISLGGGAAAALLAASSITLGWAGTLAAARLNSNVVQSVVDDTNITGTIAAQTLTFAWNGTLAAARLNPNVVQSVVNDTNIQGAIAAQTLTFSWAGTLAAARLNSNVVQSVVDDTNITGTIAAQTLTFAWSGTLAAARLNPNVVQAVTNDTNIRGSISAQNLTFSWLGTLAVARGGTGGGAASGTLLDNITGFSSTGFLTRTGAGAYAFQSATNGITNANLAQAAAWTLKGNPTGATANEQDFTIDSLTLKASPGSTDEVPIWDAAAGAMKKATVSSLASAGSVGSLNGQTGAVTIAGASGAGGIVYVPQGGFANKLRNSSLSAWFHGSGALTITTSGGWGAEGIYIVPTGASVTAQQQAPSGLSSPLSYNAQKITGNTSVTDLVVRFVVESLDAAALAGRQVTFQVPVLNNTGGSITPTLTVKRATAGQDNYSTTAADVSAASLQAIANGATGTLAYSWAVPAGGNLGFSIDIDFGNNFGANTKSIQIGGGFDCRVTPAASTGTVAAPPAPEIRNPGEDIAWCERFYETSYDNGTPPGTATHTGMVNAGDTYSSGNSTSEGNQISFRVPKRVTAPTMSVYDGAGNSGVGATLDAGTWHENQNTMTLILAGMKGAIWSNNRLAGGAGQNNFMHYVADATVTGA